MPTTRIEIVKQHGSIDGTVKIFSDDYQVYGFKFTTFEGAISKLAKVRELLDRFPVSLGGRADCEILVGRKVYWREFPAIISDFDGERGRVRLTADNTEKCFVVAPWERDEKPDHFAMVWEDLLSPKIYWFRECDED